MNRRADHAVEETELLATLLDDTPVNTWVKDAQFRYRYVNALAQEGSLCEESIVGMDDYEIVPPEIAQQLREHDEYVLTTGDSVERIEHFPNAEGAIRRWLVKKFPVEVASGETWVGGMALDVTEMKETELGLKQTIVNFDTYFKNLDLGTVELSCDGIIRNVSDRFCEICGYDREELVGQMTPVDLVHPDDAEKTIAQIAGLFAGEQNLLSEKRCLRKDGATIWYRISATCLRDDSNEIVGVTAVVEDITHRKETEAELIHSRAKLESAQRVGRVGSWDKEISSDSALHWSPETCRIFGVSPDSFQGTIGEFADCVHPDDRQRVLDQFLSQEPNRYELEYRIVLPGEDVRIIHQIAEVIGETPTGPGRHVGVVRDVTEQRENEEKLRRSEERYRLVAKSTRDPIWEFDIPKSKVTWNDTYDEMFGIRPEETSGSWDWWTQRISDEDRERVATSLESVLNDPYAEHWAEDYHFRAADGRMLFIQDRAFISRDQAGNPLRIVGTMRDQTHVEETMKQREELIRSVQEAHKLESLGVLAGGIAHDFNNLLTAVLGNISLIKSGLQNPTAQQECLADAENAALQAAELCRQMLAYAGKGKFVVRSVDLTSVVREIVQLLNVSINKKTNLHMDLNANLPRVQVDVAQINQVIMNLIMNASESIDTDAGEVTLTTGTINLDKDHSQRRNFNPMPPAGSYVYVEVKDNGCGMDDETTQRIFEPFYTTKFTGRGLGLSAVLGIVRGHHGAIRVQSELGVGTVIRVLLPAVDVSTPTEEGSSPTGNSRHSQSTLLVIDDEKHVRNTTRRVLEHQGYKVIVATDGEEGIRQYRLREQEIDLILLDLTMPRMDGHSAFRAIREVNSEVPVILTSGFDEKEATIRFDRADLAGFLHKPFVVETLVEMIDRALRPADSSG